MNRRHFLVALAVSVPIALFIPAKIAASWRPVALGRITSAANSGTPIVVGPDVVLISDAISESTTFDLAQGKRTSRKIQGVCKDGVATWSRTFGPNPQLIISRDGATHAYDLSRDLAERLGQSSSYAKVLDAPDRVELLYEDRYFRWKPGVAAIEREVQCKKMDFEQADAAVTRDGKSVVDVRNEGYHGKVAWFSTKDGSRSRYFKTQTSARYGADYLSNFGTYAIYTKRVPVSEITQKWEVVDTGSGRLLWSCPCPSGTEFLAISPDETRIAISRLAARKWEIRALRTGQILRTLPLVPQAQDAAFSPDNATLYSVAKGVIYRQRAR